MLASDPIQALAWATLLSYLSTIALAVLNYCYWRPQDSDFFQPWRIIYAGIFVSLTIHLALGQQLIFIHQHINLSLIPLLIGIGWSALFWVMVTSYRRFNPLLTLILLGFNGIAVSLQLSQPDIPQVQVSNLWTATHALIATVAYTLYAILSIQALLIWIQEKNLRQQQLNWLIGLFQPLELAEKSMHALVWLCFLWLSAALISGAWVLTDWFAQQVVHKTVFTLVAWLISLYLLQQRKRLAVDALAKLILISFSLLFVGVMGSKFVIEFVL